MRVVRFVLFAVLALAAGVLAACGGDAGPSGGGVAAGCPRPAPGFEVYEHNGCVPRPANATDIYIVYAPEAEQYMPEVIRRFNQSYADGIHPVTGAQLTESDTPIYVWGTQPETGSSGTVADGIVNAVIAPNNDNVYRPTIYQPSVSHWLSLVNQNSGRQIFNVAEARDTALSPVIIGIWEDRLNQLIELTGKSREEIGWNDLLDVLQNGWPDGRRAVYYGHADPRHSSTGLSTTIVEFYACARLNGFEGRRLTPTEVDDPVVQECMREVQSLVRHYSRRTEDFLEYFGQGPDYLDMLALEETDMICINLGAQQGDQQCLQPQGGRLMALYPAEGTFWHGHPNAIVQYDVAQGGWTTQVQRDAGRVFTDYMLTEEPQEYIMSFGFRPANPNVQIGYPFVEENGVLPEGPRTILDVPDTDVISAIRRSWTLVKKQADVMIVIDVSGSMNTENKLSEAKEAAQIFINGMESNNRVGLAIFSDGVTVRVPLDTLESNRQALEVNIRNLTASGGTELYGAVQDVVGILNDESDAGRVRAVVILSDGEDTGSQGISLNDAIRTVQESRDSLNPVIVIPVAYGSSADINSLNAIAQASRTAIQSGDPANIGRVLELLASYF